MAVWFVVGKIYATSLRVLVQIVLKHTQSWKLHISFPYIYSETLLNWTPSIPETPLIPNISCGPKSTCSYTHNPFKPNLSCHPGVSGLERFYCSLYSSNVQWNLSTLDHLGTKQNVQFRSVFASKEIFVQKKIKLGPKAMVQRTLRYIRSLVLRGFTVNGIRNVWYWEVSL